MAALVLFYNGKKLVVPPKKNPFHFMDWQKNPGFNLTMMEFQDILRSLGKTVMVRHLVKRNLTQLLKEKNLCSQVALYWSRLDLLIAALSWKVD
jgi:hypothetical protein